MNMLSKNIVLHINDKYTNNIKHKVLNKNCWFCETVCKDFVSICDFCKQERLKKVKKG
jgi:hypothetical protein